MDEVVLSMTISQLIGFSTDSSIFHEMKNGEYPKNLEFSPFFSVPDVIRTRGLPLRRRTLYPAELQKRIKNRSFLPELNLCYSFVIFTWSMFEHSLRSSSPHRKHISLSVNLGQGKS